MRAREGERLGRQGGIEKVENGYGIGVLGQGGVWGRAWGRWDKGLGQGKGQGGAGGKRGQDGAGGRDRGKEDYS